MAESKPVKKVSVVIPNWNGQRHLSGCLDALRAQTELPLYLSETALIYDVDSEACEAEQAAFAAYLRSLDGLRLAVWYTAAGNGWRHSDLWDRAGPKPSYFAWVGLDQ